MPVKELEKTDQEIEQEEQQKRAAQAGVDQAPMEEDKPAEEPEPKPLDQIEPKFSKRIWKFVDGDTEAEYTQGVLGFMAKMQFFALIGDTIQGSMDGQNGLTIDGIMGMASGAQNLFMNSTGGLSLANQSQGNVDAFLMSVARVSTIAPDFLLESFCIWLAVPQGDRDWVKNCMSRTVDEENPEQGGLSDDAFFELVENFIDQNGQAMWDFFTVRVPALAKRAQERMNTSLPDGQSQSSKPLSPTRRRTRKQ